MCYFTRQLLVIYWCDCVDVGDQGGVVCVHVIETGFLPGVFNQPTPRVEFDQLDKVEVIEPWLNEVEVYLVWVLWVVLRIIILKL